MRQPNPTRVRQPRRRHTLGAPGWTRPLGGRVRRHRPERAMEFRPHRVGQEEGESEIGIGKWSWIWMHAGACPGCPLGRRHNDTSLPTAVAVAGMKGGQAADLGPNQTRRHIVPALKAGGRHANEREMKMGRAVSTAQRSPYAKTGTSKGAPAKTLADGSKATIASASAAGSEGTRQSEQSSGWAQAWPACSQSAETSSQAQ